MILKKLSQKNEPQGNVVINTTFKLYDKLLNIYTTQYNNLPQDSKKRVNVLNEPKP